MPIGKTKPEVPIYKGEKDLTTKLLKDLQGRSEVSSDYIRQRIVSGDLNLKQVEKDLANEVLERLTKSDDPLIKEARKYKSAEEFIRNKYDTGKALNINDTVPDEVLSVTDKRLHDLVGVELPEKYYQGWQGITLGELANMIEGYGLGDDVFRESNIALRKRGYTRLGDMLLTEDGKDTI